MAKPKKTKDLQSPGSDAVEAGGVANVAAPEEMHIVTLTEGSLPEGREFEVLDNGAVRVKKSDLKEGERFKEINGKVYIEYKDEKGVTFLM